LRASGGEPNAVKDLPTEKTEGLVIGGVDF
jgi:hypothetical protein